MGPLIDPLNPYRPRQPHFAPRARSVIFPIHVGGPSHVDLFDYKPELQRLGGKPVPDSIRNALLTTRHANVVHGCKDELMASPFQCEGDSGRPRLSGLTRPEPESKRLPYGYACPSRVKKQ